jgi:ATP-dependent DNA ligase
MFAAVCDLGLEGIVQETDAPYRSGPTRNWIKVKNPNAPAATRVLEEASNQTSIVPAHHVSAAQ